MKKTLTLFFLIFVFGGIALAQVEDRFSLINENEVEKYAQPLATVVGTTLNSPGYFSASIPKLFSFSFSIRGMLIMIPDDQKTFKPNLPEGYESDRETATIFGDQGGYYAGPNGYITYPGGLDIGSIPSAYAQITAGFYGTELMLRYVPEIKVGETDFSLFGAGIRHSISQYFKLFPLDVAVQGFYSNLKVGDIIDATNYAFNVHASKSFGVFTAYGGLQLENTKSSVEYTIEGDPNSGDPLLQEDREVKAEFDGENSFRFTLGGSIRLAIFVINADYNISSQQHFTAGLTFAF